MKTQASLIVAAALLAVSCITPPNTAQPMQGSDLMPAGQGTVTAAKSENQNTALTIRVKHLAPAMRISDEARVYVVWVEPPNGAPQNVGILTVDSELDGTLTTLTPHRRFRVFVTPEPTGQVTEPSGQEVFTSEVERSEY